MTRLAFGDSYTYVQGTAGLQNYSFIGDLQNYSYSPQTLLTDEIVQNQVRTSNIMKNDILAYGTCLDWHISWRTKLGRISHRMLLRPPFKMWETALGLCIRWFGCLNNIVRPPLHGNSTF
jgi:hypothetical protein